MVICICQQKHNHHTQHNTQQHTQQHTQISNPPSRRCCLCCHIYNNSDNDNTVVSEAEEVSGINNNLSDDDSVDSCNDKEETEENQFFHDAPDIQNWTTSRSIGMAFMEDHRFHSLFGVHIEIALIVWGMLWEEQAKHLLWMLAGGSKHGAIDPKTLQKWMWIFFERIAKLA
jgi:hypothetical protein